QRLQRDTDARILWANTTPVNEAWHHERKGFDRFEADVDAYNREAAAVCSQLEIPVHDLYDVVLKDGRDKLLQEDGVHFKADGCALLGKAVARAIRDGLRR
ncbi:MAG: hypothetical protein O2954_20700, partial [bacterium]|nr:hypothetical protein [bacterium]